ncbi:MAG: T9SS type A sorting domain-containing protein [Candidatus Eisenbacteria bacterium]|nr:T9SS type A sorting domain-containing protein [Candidatus Latescibacterota bacterium]MBD3300875.1 T9SS type A sorting domain-containing protein [Candidatus Eisenbacteria bacterium]
MGKMRERTVAAAMALAVVSLASGAGDSRAELDLDWHTMDGGGWTFSIGGRYGLGGTVGQTDAGVVAGGSLQLLGGFWMGGGIPTAVEDFPIDETEGDEEIAFGVLAGVPNPFTDATCIMLSLPEARSVEVTVFDHTGRVVRRLCRREVSAGHHRFDWDGRAGNGHRVASGVYLVKIRAGDDVSHKRLIRLR